MTHHPVPEPATPRQPKPPAVESDNPVIVEVVAALHRLSGGRVEVAREIIGVTASTITDREAMAALGWLGHTYRECALCGGRVVFEIGSPDPGWWRHHELPNPMHPAVPICSERDGGPVQPQGDADDDTYRRVAEAGYDQTGGML